MKRTEIELIAQKLVKYVEDNQFCTRLQATSIIPAGISTLKAWDAIKHLFDYGRFDGARATYERNQEPYSFRMKTRSEAGAPPKWITELAAVMQDMVNKEYGITGFQIRQRLDLDMITFKRAAKLVKADRRRGVSGNGSAYFPIDAKIKVELSHNIQPIEYIDIGRWNLPILTQWRTSLPWAAKIENQSTQLRVNE